MNKVLAVNKQNIAKVLCEAGFTHSTRNITGFVISRERMANGQNEFSVWHHMKDVNVVERVAIFMKETESALSEYEIGLSTNYNTHRKVGSFGDPEIVVMLKGETK